MIVQWITATKAFRFELVRTAKINSQCGGWNAPAPLVQLPPVTTAWASQEATLSNKLFDRERAIQPG